MSGAPSARNGPKRSATPSKDNNTRLQPRQGGPDGFYVEIKGCRAVRSCCSPAIVCHIGRSGDAGGDRRGKSRNKLFKLFASPSFRSPLLFHDSAPEECRLPWKLLGPLLGWLSGLLSRQREPRECFEDGSHFCSVFSGGKGVSLLSALWSCTSVRDRLSVLPGAGGTRLHLARRSAAKEAQARQPKAALLPLPKRSPQGAHPCSSLGAALTVSHSGCNLRPRQAVTASGQHTAALV